MIERKKCNNCGPKKKMCEWAEEPSEKTGAFFCKCMSVGRREWDEQECDPHMAYRQQVQFKLHLAMELSNISFVATADEGNHRAIRTIVDDALFEVGLVDKEIG